MAHQKEPPPPPLINDDWIHTAFTSNLDLHRRHWMTYTALLDTYTAWMTCTATRTYTAPKPLALDNLHRPFLDLHRPLWTIYSALWIYTALSVSGSITTCKAFEVTRAKLWLPCTA
mmetsp:Transcript_16443/g.39125  ORF Transcript_16443/g.39125 Transcript_16443/m.39125 type:complete len:116 (+) Transcript_16443:167-514(+)